MNVAVAGSEEVGGAEAKEAAAYEAFQKLKAENRNETTAVNIDQQ